MALVELDIVRLPRRGFVICEGRAPVTDTIYPTEEDAYYRLPALTRQLTDARAKVRFCLCCPAVIRSTGPGHRLCDDCRRAA
ncbi:MAG: hypothetical protein U5N55_07945 [Cypionkella sp.]|nr:hypothetical protein [Cypionkella sp.]